jgi:hypothetical protein
LQELSPGAINVANETYTINKKVRAEIADVDVNAWKLIERRKPKMKIIKPSSMKERAGQVML